MVSFAKSNTLRAAGTVAVSASVSSTVGLSIVTDPGGCRVNVRKLGRYWWSDVADKCKQGQRLDKYVPILLVVGDVASRLWYKRRVVAFYLSTYLRIICSC